MVQLSAKLSQVVEQVRVDFHNIDGKIYFGEMTLYPYSGLERFGPEKWDKIMGSWWKVLIMKQVFNLKKNNTSCAKYYFAVFLIFWLWIMYILCGCETIAEFWRGGIGNKIGLGFIGALISLLLMYVMSA